MRVSTVCTAHLPICSFVQQSDSLWSVNHLPTLNTPLYPDGLVICGPTSTENEWFFSWFWDWRHEGVHPHTRIFSSVAIYASKFCSVSTCYWTSTTALYLNLRKKRRPQGGDLSERDSIYSTCFGIEDMGAFTHIPIPLLPWLYLPSDLAVCYMLPDITHSSQYLNFRQKRKVGICLKKTHHFFSLFW